MKREAIAKQIRILENRLDKASTAPGLGGKGLLMPCARACRSSMKPLLPIELCESSWLLRADILREAKSPPPFLCEMHRVLYSLKISLS